MRVVFITHNELGLACLEELAALGADIRAVYTRPKHEKIADQTDLSAFAGRESIQLNHVESVNTDAVTSEIRRHAPDLLFVIGWSRLVDTKLLEIPSIAALGMHPAPLPRGRGRAPIAWSLIKGLDETALSFFHLVEKADAGDIVGQKVISIDIGDDVASLYEKVVDAGRELIRMYYPEFERGNVPQTPQDDAKATWWPKREPHHGLIDWTDSPHKVYDWIRGQTKPYPGAFSYLDDRKIIIWAAAPPTDDPMFSTPGEIVYRDDKHLGVGAWEGIIELTEVQVDDDDPVAAGELLTEYEFEIGDLFENARNSLGQK